MGAKNIIAFDESQRFKDKNGHLIVKESVITKESVDPYYGRDIPDYEKHGLEPDKVYYLYRPLEEIEKAIETFKRKQLLFKHNKVDSTDTKKEITVGAIGSDLKIKDGKLYGDMAFWDQNAIDLIEAKKMEQLSNGYWYTVKMDSGEFNGTKYDGIMTNLHGNHVALVERGRIGDDAIICDEQTVKGLNMKFKKGSMPKIVEAMRLAMDSEEVTEEALADVVDAIDEGREDETTHDSSDLKEKLGVTFDENQVAKIMEILGAVAKPEATDEAPEEPETADDEEEEEEKPAMDAAMIEQNAIKKVTALFEARKEVEPFVGVVAMDSAEDVYKFALEQKGVSTKGVHPSAYKAMVGLLQKQSGEPKVAMDSAQHSRDNLEKLAPHIKTY